MKDSLNASHPGNPSSRKVGKISWLTPKSFKAEINLPKLIAQFGDDARAAPILTVCVGRKALNAPVSSLGTTWNLDAYLDELEHRFSNRKNEHVFRDTLTKLVNATKWPYQELVQKAA
jgi:hypothetical protein